MSLPAVSIRRPVFAWMLMASLIIFGGISFTRMGVSQLPDVDFPVVSINVSLEGAAPGVMEVEVVDPLEDALMGVQGIRSMSSSARTGSASITVEFDLEKDINVALQDVQSVVSQTQRRLPKEVDPPSVRKSNSEDSPIIWMSVSSGKLSKKELMSLVRDRIKDRFATIEGVGEVFLGGYVEPALRVWLSSSKLNYFELAASDIIQTIQQEHIEYPSGRLELKEKELNIRTMGEALSVEEFGLLAINRRGGSPNYRPVLLKDVVTIEEGLSDIRRVSRTNGQPSVGLGIRKQRGSNAVSVGKEVKKQMALVAAELPEGTEIGIRFDSTEFIEEAISELNFTILLAAILTALVCWLFLGSWSSTFNIILAIPTSLVGCFIALHFLGFTLNTFTLLGLSLAIGIVVDDAIMVLENIVRHREMGKTRMQAALDGAQEVSFAALAATGAIIAIFLPVAFMDGVIGKFFFQFGITLSIAVAISLLEALTLTPMRSSQFLEVKERTDRLGHAIETALARMTVAYQKLIMRLLDHRWKVIGGSLLFFLLSLIPLKFLGREFVPSQDQGTLIIRAQTPVGSSLSHTDEKFKAVEQFLSARPEVESYFASIGGFGGTDANSGMSFITLKEKSKRGKNPSNGKVWTQQDLATFYRSELKKVEGLRVVVQEPSSGAFGSRRGFPIEFTVRGPDWEMLGNETKKLMKAMEETGLMTDVDSDFIEGMPEARVLPDRVQARTRGVSVSEIGQTIGSAIGGVMVGRYSKDGRRNDIRVRLVENDRKEIADILRLKVRNNRGELIPLSEVTKLEIRPALQSISRLDRERAITVSASLAPGQTQAEVLAKVSELTKKLLPEGYRAVFVGSAKTLNESFSSLVFALILGIIVAWMILASQFNSYIDPFTVLVALPFSISGALAALLIGGQTINIYSMIGILLLMGIVKKNSILLVDFANQVRDTGVGPREALIEACPKRFRPILMTSVSTIAGAVPAALAWGPGAESRVPMALAVIGGVMVSTVLTLIVVPCVYSVFSSKQGAKKAIG